MEKVVQETWMLDLADEAENIVWECIETMTANKYWQNLDK